MPVSYSIDRAHHLAEQLERLATQNVHQLAGQAAILAFWVNEIEQTLESLDDYPARFEKILDAQKDFVEQHEITGWSFCPHCEGRCEFADGSEPPDDPVRISHREFANAREAVLTGTRHFLIRLLKNYLVSEEILLKLSEKIGSDFSQGSLEAE